jgi:peptide/nickel transport system substrate-binding protein
MKKLFCSIIMLIGALLVTGCGTPAAQPTLSPVASTSTILTSTALTPTQTSSTAVAKPTTSASAPMSSTAATQVSPQRYGGTLRIITSAAPGTPIGWPAEIAGATTSTAQICLDFLLHFDSNGNLNPNLCTSFDINTNAQNPSITFHLRKGVKFHDGSDFNAQVVKWNLEQIKTGVNVSTIRYWKSFDVVDNDTIRINLTEWQNGLAASFGATATCVVSQAAYEKHGLDWMRKNMVGTAAFKQQNFKTDVILQTKRSDNYWETGKPYLDGLEYIYVADGLTQLALFKSGGADILNLGSNYKTADDLKKDGYRIVNMPNRISFLLPDSKNEDSPWSNIKVRQAAEYAIDKDALNSALGFGYAKTAYQLALPNGKAYVPTISGRKYDVAKAKQLLSEAGYPEGFKTKIIASSADNRDITVGLQSFLNKIGIQTTLEYVEPARWQAIQTGTWNNGCLYTGVEFPPNFNLALGLWWGTSTAWFQSMKKPDGWSEILTASLVSAQPEPALMQKCVQALFDNVTIVPISYGTALWATTDKVNDVGLTDRGAAVSANYQNAWLSP